MLLQDYITESANIALTLTFIVGLILGVVQIKAVERDRRERLTLETLRNFQTRDFAELLQFVIDPKFPKNQAELDALTPAQWATYIQFSQHMETLGMMVAENFIDMELVDKTLGSFVTTSWEKYKVIFVPLRERDPFFGEYFQWLSDEITEHMKVSPREPFHLKGNK